MSKKVLVTGGAGFIGHLAIKEILSSTDWEVITFDRLSYAGDLNRINYVLEEVGNSSDKRLKFISCWAGLTLSAWSFLHIM